METIYEESRHSQMAKRPALYISSISRVVLVEQAKKTIKS
jgi:hypothetical protein